MNITHEQIRRLLDYDPETGMLTWRKRSKSGFSSDGAARYWNQKHAGHSALRYTHREGYKKGKILGKDYLAHRVIWFWVTGAWPQGQVDHINGDRSDNRWGNLRDVSALDNRRNAALSTRNKTGRIGVCWSESRAKYFAHIKVERKTIWLGAFDDLEDAASARKAAEIKFGFHENHGRTA